LREDAHADAFEGRGGLAGSLVDDLARALRTTSRSTSARPGTRTPKRSAVRARCAILALRSITFVGTHP
jgi:hypothetical protein